MKLVAFANILFIKVTFEVSQKLISELNDDLSLKTSVILVTRVVHTFTFPLSASPCMVELSTTVYIVPDIDAVSPTEALGHLHVPFSKYIDVVEAGFTTTVLVTVAVLLAASATLYTSVYVPTVEVSTVPVTVIELVISPSVSSVAVAPGSVHESPKVSCIVDDPFRLIVGGVVFAFVVELAAMVNSPEIVTDEVAATIGAASCGVAGKL